MATSARKKRVWKQTTHFITLEPVDDVIREIYEETMWPEEQIQQQLFDQKKLIRIPGAKYHIYRDCLG